MTTENNALKPFNRSAANFNKMTQEAIAAIVEYRPDLADAVFTKAAQGNTALTLLTESEVFKTGQHDQWESSIEREGYIMKWLKGRGMKVPEITTIGSEYQMLGMKRIPGVVLWDVFSSLTSAERRAIARDIAIFKVQLENAATHQNLKRIDSHWTTLMDRSKQYLELGDVQKTLAYYPGLNAKLNEYRKKAEKRSYVLMHCDLHAHNILVDPETHRVTAFLDFGSTHFTPVPEMEFVNQYDKYGHYGDERKMRYDHAFLRMIEKNYAHFSDISSEADLYACKLIYHIYDKTHLREAPWTEVGDKDYNFMKKLIEKAAKALNCPALDVAAKSKAPLKITKSRGR